MAETTGVILELLKRAAPPKRVLNRRAGPVSEASGRRELQATLVQRAPKTHKWTFGPEIPLVESIGLQRLPDPVDRTFHRKEFTFDDDALGALGPACLIVADTPLEAAQVYIAPLQTAGSGDAGMDGDLLAKAALFNPTGFARQSVDASTDRAFIEAVLAVSTSAHDIFLTTKEGRRASLALPLVAAAVFPPGFLYRQAAASYGAAPRGQRLAVIGQSFADIGSVHAEIVDALGGKRASWQTAAASGQIRMQGAAADMALIDQAIDIAAWQALAGSDARRGFGEGSGVEDLARVYVDNAIHAWIKANLAGSMLLQAGGAEAGVGREILEIVRFLDGVTNPENEEAMLRAAKDAIEGEFLTLSPRTAEKLLTAIVGRLHALSNRPR